MALVKYEKENYIAVITLNRPEKLNAFNFELISEMGEVCKTFENDKEVRVGIITGSGRAFSAGADVNSMSRRNADGNAEYYPIYKHMRKLTKPVISAVNGLAVGSGLWEVILQSEIRIAAESATFSFPEIKMAIPAGPERFLAQNIPFCFAMELCITGDSITSQRAYEIGMINKVVPDKELMTEAKKIANRMAELSPWAISLIKQSGLRAVDLSEQIWDLEERRQARQTKIFSHEDHLEAIKAFTEKRKPIYKDR
ncbi:enoyl-CoA hydratase/isomerase family protein [Thermodesulfobacteriota bacterium]